MKAMKLVESFENPTEPKAAWYLADPDVIYPKTLDYITKLIESGNAFPSSLGPYIAEAKKLPQGTFQRVKFGEPNIEEDRVLALELARLVFTELLHLANAQMPMGLRITPKDREEFKKKWKLSSVESDAPGLKGAILRNV